MQLSVTISIYTRPYFNVCSSLIKELSCSFFPTVLQPPIQAVGDAVYSCLVRVKLCRRPIRRYDVGAPSSIAISLPGMDPHDAERRR